MQTRIEKNKKCLQTSEKNSHFHLLRYYYFAFLFSSLYLLLFTDGKGLQLWRHCEVNEKLFLRVLSFSAFLVIKIVVCHAISGLLSKCVENHRKPQVTLTLLHAFSPTFTYTFSTSFLNNQLRYRLQS